MLFTLVENESFHVKTVQWCIKHQWTQIITFRVGYMEYNINNFMFNEWP